MADANPGGGRDPRFSNWPLECPLMPACPPLTVEWIMGLSDKTGWFSRVSPVPMPST